MIIDEAKKVKTKALHENKLKKLKTQILRGEPESQMMTILAMRSKFIMSDKRLNNGVNDSMTLKSLSNMTTMINVTIPYSSNKRSHEHKTLYVKHNNDSLISRYTGEGNIF